MRIRTHLKRSKLLMMVFASLAFAAMRRKNDFGGPTQFQVVPVSTRKVSATDTLSVASVCHSSTETTYAYRLNAPKRFEKQPRPSHWFHSIEFHLPLIVAEHSKFVLSSDPFNLLLIFPNPAWISELRPMVRFFLAAIYSAPFARRGVRTVPPQKVIFLSGENIMSGVHGIGSAEVEAQSACIVTKRSYMWASTIRQPLLDRFVLEDALVCRNTDKLVTFDIQFVPTTVVKSGTEFGSVKSPVHGWFVTAESVRAMRESFEMLCQYAANTDELLAELPFKVEKKMRCLSEMFKVGKKKRHAVIYQRDMNRKFSDFDRVKQSVIDILGSGWSVNVIMHDDNNPPCLLYHCLKHTELLITPHGFQSMLTMFLPTRAYMFEISPARYRWTGYKALGLMFSVRHIWVESYPLSMFGHTLSAVLTTKHCMASYFCRYLVRKCDVSLDKRSLSVLAQIGRGSFVESSQIHLARNSTNNRVTFGSCAALCERDDDCFAARLVQGSCLHVAHE